MRKRVWLSVMLVCLTVLMCSCMAIPPDQNTSGNIGGLGTPTPALPTDEPKKDTNSSASTDSVTPAPVAPFNGINRVQLFVDATMPMMGFVDMEERSDYIALMESCRTAAAQCFPNGREYAYRIDIEQPLKNSVLVNGLSLQEASDPSFYLSSDLTHYPAKVYSTPSDSHRSSERFNEFHLSYYHAYGKTEPANDVQTQNPVAWAIHQMDSSLDNIAIIFSDLSELQFDSSKLTTAIQTQVFGQGKTIGVLAMKSNFSGLIPMSNGWFIWGSEPTGTLWKMLDYTYYELGISIDPELRQTAQHPLYVICIGESDAVNRFVNTLNSQMNIRFTDEALQLNLRAFDVDFGTKNVNIADSVTLVFNTQEGMNLVDEGKRLRTVTLQRMRGEYDENTNPRYVIYKVTYPGKITDPRTSFGYNPSDFTVSTEIAKREKNNGITPMSSPTEDQLKCTVIGTELVGKDVEVSIQVEFPFQKLERGDYDVKISMQLNPPGDLGEPVWVSDYHIDYNSPDSFDGSKTVGLNALFSHKSACQETVISKQYTDLGDFTFKLRVND